MMTLKRPSVSPNRFPSFPSSTDSAAVANQIASTSGTDSGWVVKLIDVCPTEVPSKPEMGAYQLALAMDIFRGRYRESFETPKALGSNVSLRYRFVLPTTNHAFLPGSPNAQEARDEAMTLRVASSIDRNRPVASSSRSKQSTRNREVQSTLNWYLTSSRILVLCQTCLLLCSRVVSSRPISAYLLRAAMLSIALRQRCIVRRRSESQHELQTRIR
jgi:hypothetical protein